MSLELDEARKRKDQTLSLGRAEEMGARKSHWLSQDECWLHIVP